MSIRELASHTVDDTYNVLFNLKGDTLFIDRVKALVPFYKSVTNNLTLSESKAIENIIATMQLAFNKAFSGFDTMVSFDAYNKKGPIIFEQIFGEGLAGHANRHMLILELLLTLASQPVSLDDDYDYMLDIPLSGSERAFYLKQEQVRLRTILFLYRQANYINRQNDKDDGSKWQQWRASVAKISASMHKSRERSKILKESDLDDLRDKFNSFSDFVKCLNTLLADTITDENSNGWRHKFLVPFGPNALFYEDSDDNGLSFSGCGQSVLLMLIKSLLDRDYRNDTVWRNTTDDKYVDSFKQSYCDEATQALRELTRRFLNPSEPYDMLIAKIASKRGHEAHTVFSEINKLDINARLCACDEYAKMFSDFRGTSTHSLEVTAFLPPVNHKIFGQIAQDFNALLKSDLPRLELFKALGILAMLNLSAYMLEQMARLNHSLGHEVDINQIVLIDDNDNAMRAASSASLRRNQDLFAQVNGLYVRAFLMSFMQELMPDFAFDKELKPESISVIADVMAVIFYHNSAPFYKSDFGFAYKSKRKKLSESINTVDKLIENYLSECQMVDAGASYSAFCREAGLIGTHEGDIDNYFTLSDDLIINVTHCLLRDSDYITLKEFCSELYTRYHIVISQHEGKDYLKDEGDSKIEQDSFSQNQSALEDRLNQLGLLHSLSDGCLYVKKPHTLV